MFNLHKRTLKYIRKEKGRNHNKSTLYNQVCLKQSNTIKDEIESYTTNITKVGGTGKINLCCNTPQRQYSIDTQEKRYIGEDNLLHIESGQWNHRDEIYGKRCQTKPPKEWRTHDRSRWIRNKNKTKCRNNAKTFKENNIILFE